MWWSVIVLVMYMWKFWETHYYYNYVHVAWDIMYRTKLSDDYPEQLSPMTIPLAWREQWSQSQHCYQWSMVTGATRDSYFSPCAARRPNVYILNTKHLFTDPFLIYIYIIFIYVWASARLHNMTWQYCLWGNCSHITKPSLGSIAV